LSIVGHHEGDCVQARECSRRVPGRFSLLLSALLLASAQAWAQSPPANDDCLACHGDSSAQRADGGSVAVAADTFSASVHGAAGTACVDCHADLASVTEFPHPEKLARVDCSTCHDDAATKHGASVHSQVAGGKPSAACADCHGAHDILPSANPASRTYHLNVPNTCGTCHGAQGTHGRAPQVSAQYQDSIHGQALSRRGLLVAPNCASCHTAHEVRPKADPKSTVHGANVVKTCTTCHAGIQPAFGRSVHAAALSRGDPRAPTCASCHTAHGITRTEVERWQLDVVSECGTCHAESLRTYRDTFHGKVTALGFTRVAKCADCHGAHDILPASNPVSPISVDRRVETCRKCHASANQRFATYDPHADANDPERSPALYYTSRFMKGLLGSVFAFFGIHTLLWFPRSLHARRARNRRERTSADQEG
jgi:nitrate/TMAO reductase-like tetraheme cytochrome c subunit